MLASKAPQSPCLAGRKAASGGSARGRSVVARYGVNDNHDLSRFRVVGEPAPWMSTVRMNVAGMQPRDVHCNYRGEETINELVEAEMWRLRSFEQTCSLTTSLRLLMYTCQMGGWLAAKGATQHSNALWTAAQKTCESAVTVESAENLLCFMMDTANMLAAEDKPILAAELYVAGIFIRRAIFHDLDSRHSQAYVEALSALEPALAATDDGVDTSRSLWRRVESTLSAPLSDPELSATAAKRRSEHARELHHPNHQPGLALDTALYTSYVSGVLDGRGLREVAEKLQLAALDSAADMAAHQSPVSLSGPLVVAGDALASVTGARHREAVELANAMYAGAIEIFGSCMNVASGDMKAVMRGLAETQIELGGTSPKTGDLEKHVEHLADFVEARQMGSWTVQGDDFDAGEWAHVPSGAAGGFVTLLGPTRGGNPIEA